MGNNRFPRDDFVSNYALRLPVVHFPRPPFARFDVTQESMPEFIFPQYVRIPDHNEQRLRTRDGH